MFSKKRDPKKTKTTGPAVEQPVPSAEQNNPVKDSEPADKAKRNSGRTGPTTIAGKAIASRNATRHGMCATTLILDNEFEEDWLQLLTSWLSGYENPAENSLLYTFVLKTAQSEWQRLRAQKEYDYFQSAHNKPPLFMWEPENIKRHDLVQRYLTAAERKFQREYRMLEHHWKTHHKPVQKTAEPKPEPQPEVGETAQQQQPQRPPTLFVNNETGEAIDSQGNYYPPPPDYKPEPIIPGVYGPDHPNNLGHPKFKKGGRQR